MIKAPFRQEICAGPENVQAYWLTTEDDRRVRIAHWPNETSSKGTILIFQGRTENIEKYGRAVTTFCDQGYSVLAIDWRGQGMSDRLASDRLLGHVHDFSDYQHDVTAFLDGLNTLKVPKPWFLFGHSLGACVGLRALSAGFPVDACAFTAPLWDINLAQPKRAAAWALSWAAHTLGQGMKYAPGTKGESYVLVTPFSENRLTQDPEMYRYYQHISRSLVDQQIGGPSMTWLYRTLQETRALKKVPSPHIPCVTFIGADDSIVAVSAAEERMNRWPDGKLNIIPDAKHDVLYEAPQYRDQVFSEIDNLFSAR